MSWFLYLPYFNSIKVRLKLIVCDFLEVADTFQFHKGTIKTWGVLDERIGIAISIP